MKKIIYIFSFLCISLYANALKDSTSAYISILTCQPGTQEYSRFGHTAIRYCDASRRTDIVFNFGLFSYSNDFAYNFVKGETYYRLGVTQFQSFISEYYIDNRSVIEQKLNISQQEVQQIFDILRENYRPENREYLYNFFIDNCSTRPRDVLQKVLGNTLQWNKVGHSLDTTWIKPLISTVEKNTFTWRDLIHQYVGINLWLRFGIDLGIGAPADTLANLQSAMFLPDGLCVMLESATIDRNVSIEPLVAQTQYLYKAELQQNEKSVFTPSVILWILCLIFIAIAIIGYVKKKHFYWLDSLIFILFGIAGIFVWYVSFISIHPAVFPNYNVFWANPLHVIFAVLWFIPKLRVYTKWYLYIYAILVILYIVLIPLQLQYVHMGFVALIILSISRIWKVTQ